MDRVDDLLRELHTEIIETRTQAIKTDNAVRNLGGELKAIARRQEAYERRLTVNSSVAYVLFAVLSFLGLLLFFRASIARTELDEALVAQETEALEGEIGALTADLERRRESERAAYDFYELLASGRRDEVVERFPTVQGRLLDRATIELFRREVDRIRLELASETYQAGMQHFENEQWQDARDALTRSQAYVDTTAYATDLHYRLGESLYQLGDDAGAVRYFDLALPTGELTRQQQIVAAFHRAESLRRLDRAPEAAEAYRSFARRFDSHYWAATARARASALEERLETP